MKNKSSSSKAPEELVSQVKNKILKIHIEILNPPYETIEVNNRKISIIPIETHVPEIKRLYFSEMNIYIKRHVY